MSIVNIIENLNLEISKPFAQIPGAVVYGLTELVPGVSKDNVNYVIPGVVSKSGEVKYVGYDDKSPLIIYHRLSSASQTERIGSSYGDDRTDLITTFSIALYVYADRKTLCVDQSGLLELIQASLPDILLISGYKSIILRVQTINFNTQSILRSEYQGTTAKLSPNKVLIQINYQIETTLRRKCAARCA